MASDVHRECGVEWSVVSRPMPGEIVSGDQHVVVRSRTGVLLAAIDGLGHGDEATVAARLAADVLAAHADEPIVALVQKCHVALRHTRGAAMTLVSLNRHDQTAVALGVGNVETIFVHADARVRPAREAVLLRNGVVGFRLPALQATEVAIGPGDLVVFATDGVREDFGDQVSANEPLSQLLDTILAQKFRGHDDALVLGCKVLRSDED